jgi:hypothetical protein
MLRRTAPLLAILTIGAVGFLFPHVALAEPATTVAYPAGATATRYAGLAFDTCTAPSLTAIRAWGASPYRAVGVYIGGANRPEDHRDRCDHPGDSRRQ